MSYTQYGTDTLTPEQRKTLITWAESYTARLDIPLRTTHTLCTMLRHIDRLEMENAALRESQSTRRLLFLSTVLNPRRCQHCGSLIEEHYGPGFCEPDENITQATPPEQPR